MYNFFSESKQRTLFRCCSVQTAIMRNTTSTKVATLSDLFHITMLGFTAAFSSLHCYLTFVAFSCVFTFGVNGKFSNRWPRPTPEKFLSSNNCPYSPTITCPTTPTFRPIDGSCNNADSPYSGKSETPYIRITPAMYIANKYPRNISFFGPLLPGPRQISLDFFKSTSAPSAVLSAITPTFARFVEHDLYKTKLLDGSSCCNQLQAFGECNNIYLTDTDPYFSKYSIKCLPKGNIVASTKLDCKKQGPTEQINENTHTLDLSNIYGSTSAVSDRLRTKTDGLLKVSATKNLLPSYLLSECQLSSPNLNNEHCFDAGDLRVNVDPLIMTMYTIWVRHHNVIASKLKHTIKDGSDENIFQTARKIVIAQYQHIVYNEFLPALDSKTTWFPPPAMATSQTAVVKPIIYNTFSLVYTAIVDSMVPSKIVIDNTDISLDSVYYTPAQLFKTDGIKKLLKAMQTAKAELVDRYVVDALTNSYLQKTSGSGTDKVALNLQQSRENGAPCYTIFYSLLHKKYDGKLPEIDTSQPDLQSLYPFTFDIELLPGLFSENPVTDVNYGNTTKILMDKQFKDLKEGDPFFYSNAGVLTSEKLAEIKKTTLAKILCSNGALDDVPPQALKLDSVSGNTKKDCSALADINICLWSTVEWSDWKNIGCYFGVGVFTRQCKIVPGSTCTCVGEPIKYEACPLVLFKNYINFEAIKKINATFYENFGPDGKPLNPNKSNFSTILKKMTP